MPYKEGNTNSLMGPIIIDSHEKVAILKSALFILVSRVKHIRWLVNAKTIFFLTQVIILIPCLAR